MECIAAAAVTWGVPSTPGTVGGAYGAATGAAAGAHAVETSPSEAAEVEARACCSRRVSRIGIVMIGSMVLTSNSGTVSIVVVPDRSLTILFMERLALLKDTVESRERAGVRGTHYLDSLLSVLTSTGLDALE